MQDHMRRVQRGARRETPEDNMRQAIAWHRALKAREAHRAETKDAITKADVSRPAREKQRAKAEAKRRAAFAEAMARSAFGRSYRKERPQR